MPMFEGCCSYSLIERKKSAAYAPTTTDHFGAIILLFFLKFKLINLTIC